MFLTIFLAVLPVLLVNVAKAKVYDRCELSKDLQYKYEFSKEQISKWICIVQHESQFNTSAMNHGTGDHGLFQISQIYWCSTNSIGYACNANCASFRDDDISDDVNCVKKIYKEHTKISGDGFNAWTVYGLYCKGDTSKYLEGCPDNEILVDNIVTEENEELDEDGYNFPPLPKIFNRCSLATELKEIHNVPINEVATWVCIAQHESSFNTSAVNKGGDHGLFQISELFWCSKFKKGGGCNARCSQFTDNDITDDFKCARTIFKEHTVISGNGFNAWTVYPEFCTGDNLKYIGGCPGIDKTLKTKKLSKQLNLLRPVEINKVYQRCELAQELRFIHKVPENQISTWVCIAQHESNLNTSALGNGDHGIFQISEKYWCSQFGKGSGCYAKCEDFRDGDITDDIACAQTIYYEHVGISGDGFNAWAVYAPFCKGDTEQYINDCVNLEENNSIEEVNQKINTLVPKPSYPYFNSIANIITEEKNVDTAKKSTTKKLSQSKMNVTPVKTPSFANAKPFFSNSRNGKSLVPKSNQLELRSAEPSRPRPPFPQRPSSISEKQRPPRPPRPTGYNGPPRPSGNSGPPRPAANSRPPNPPRPSGPPRPTGASRPTTARPFNWNNLPGVIFTLWPSSTTGPVSTSVYSTSPKPLPGPSLVDLETRSRDKSNIKREQQFYEPSFPGGPVMVSFPHLLYGDLEYQTSVQGMVPNKVKHETFMVLEPISGTPLYASQRIQFNMFIRPIEALESLANVSKALMPLLWIEESVIIGDQYIDMLNSQLFHTMNIINIVTWSLLVIGAACLIITVLVIIYRQAP